MIKRQVKIDKESYLDGLLEHRGWQSVKAFKNATKKKVAQISLKTQNGEDIQKTKQADAIANHFETKQWFQREGIVGHARHRIFETELPIDMDKNAIRNEEHYQQTKGQRAR